MNNRIQEYFNDQVHILIINGARSVVMHIKGKKDGLSCWVRKLLETKSFNTTVVAVANKLIRMALAMLKWLGASFIAIENAGRSHSLLQRQLLTPISGSSEHLGSSFARTLNCHIGLRLKSGYV